MPDPEKLPAPLDDEQKVALLAFARAATDWFESIVRALADWFAAVIPAVRSLVESLAPLLEDDEGAQDWPEWGSTCAHVCGPDPGHRCAAAAATTLDFSLPSGGIRHLPLCGPCHAAESAALEPNRA